MEMELTLPNGYWQGGACHREAFVRGIQEGDENLGEVLGAATLPIERTTTLLAHCVTQLGGRERPGAEAMRELAMGDREALLLHVRRMIFGERIECVVQCPACPERMDFPLQVSELLVSETGNPKQRYEEIFFLDGVRFRVKLRHVTGGDVETVVRNTPVPEAVVRGLLVHCVDWIYQEEEHGGEAVAVPAEQWPADLVAQISARLAELDPQAEIRLQLTCPVCEHSFATSFDTADYLLRELSERERRLHEEVHQLALAYHWSETDILRMTPRKRKLYLDILAGESINE